NYADATIPRLQVVRCIRIDLTDPDVQLLTTPPTNSTAYETVSLSVSNYLKKYGLAVASDANFYNAQSGGPSPSAEGVPCNVEGMLVCTGRLVAVADNARFASLVWTTNNQPSLALLNRSPGISTTGIFTAVSGYYPILTNGI